MTASAAAQGQDGGAAAARIAGKPTSGVIKDLVMADGYRKAEIDFARAHNRGLSAVERPVVDGAASQPDRPCPLPDNLTEND